jgi:Cu/Ag efflux protein CusF
MTMKLSHWLRLTALLLPWTLAGCGKSDTGAKVYDIKAKVVAIAPDKKAVTLDHEAIPGLMQAMQMDFPVAGAQVLEGIAPNDQVEGKLQVSPDRPMTVTQLRKIAAGTSGLNPAVQAARAQLDAEDQRLVAAQDYCAVQSKNRLGSMGTPFKVMVDGQPVFLCCDGCEGQALANPAKTLARVKELTNKSRDNK